jgi:hypothetical protein
MQKDSNQQRELILYINCTHNKEYLSYVNEKNSRGLFKKTFVNILCDLIILYIQNFTLLKHGINTHSKNL